MIERVLRVGTALVHTRRPREQEEAWPKTVRPRPRQLIVVRPVSFGSGRNASKGNKDHSLLTEDDLTPILGLCLRNTTDMSITSPPPAPAETLPLPAPTSQSVTRSNPISLRLWKITSRATLDQPTQEALKIVSDRYCQVASITHDGTAEAGPSRPKDYWLSSSSNWEDDSDDFFSDEEDDTPNTNGKDEKRSKKAYRSLLANADPDAAARARKSFKKDVEGELAKGSMNFLKAFGRVDEVSGTMAAGGFLVARD
jgi:hypothetical protein